MLLNARRLLIATAAWTLLSAGSGPASASAGIARVHPMAAARACAAGRPLTVRFGPADVTYLRGFVPCVLRVERSQFGLRYAQSRTLSRGMAAALARFVKLSYLTHHRNRAAVSAGVVAAGDLALTLCDRRGFNRTLFQPAWRDTAPPPLLTPLELATLLAKPFRYQHGTTRSPRATFGVAVRRGLLFRNDDLNGAAMGVITVVCR